MNQTFRGIFNHSPTFYYQAILFVAFITIGAFGTVEGQNMDTLPLGDRPRNKQNYEKPGHYEMVADLDKNELDPGDTFNISFYFSGYGQIGLSKLYFKVNKNIFLDTGCYASGGLIRDSNGHFHWTAIRQQIRAFSGGILPLGGLSRKNSIEWGVSTAYIDRTENTNDLSILTEIPIENHPPYYFHLATRNDVEPGPYAIVLVYTYFNGQEWVGEQQQLTFKIKNIIERNTGWAWIIGILTLILAFVAIIPILRELGAKVVSFLFKQNNLKGRIVGKKGDLTVPKNT
jgi:hypothetical protein